MKTNPFVYSLVLASLMPLLSPAYAQGASGSVTATSKTKIRIMETTTEPQAVVINEKGNCEYSEDGVTFKQLNELQVVKEGFVIRTADGGRADLFFRRIGTTVRLQSGTEVKLEKMTRTVKDSGAVLNTLLDLRKGRIFTVVRSFVEGSTFEIRNAAGRAVVEGGGGNGRYIITADGTHVSGKDSAIPLKVIGETGITIITPGQKFDPKEGKVFALNPSETVEGMIEFDEMSAAVEEITIEDNTDKPTKEKR